MIIFNFVKKMTCVDNNWDTLLNLNEIEDKSYNIFETNVKCICEQQLCVLDEYLFKRRHNLLENKKLSYEEHLQNLIESNRTSKQEIDDKLKDVSKQVSHYKMFKEDQRLLTKEIKELHEAFLMAKKYYKKFLKLYYTIESKDMDMQIIFVQFFTESKKDTENYTIRLKRDPKSGKYSLQDLQPKLKLFQEAQLKLQETNDVPGIICCIRDAFSSLRESKKLKGINK